MKLPDFPWRIRRPRISDKWAQRGLWITAGFFWFLVLVRWRQLRHGVVDDPRLIMDPAARLRVQREKEQKIRDILTKG